jgi:FixJ family two-component response regulator
MTKEDPTVFVVDDDASVRKSLSRLFRSAGVSVEMFASADAFLAREHFTGTGCVILDIGMPGLNGVDLHKRLRKADFSMPVIFLTGHGDIQTGVQVVKEGAVDFLTKPVDDETLLQAVREALAKDEVERAKRVETTAIRQRLQSLTDLEHEVLTYVITGMLNKQIAAALDISEKTVKVHRGRVTDKLGVQSVAELVRLAEMTGILPAEQG